MSSHILRNENFSTDLGGLGFLTGVHVEMGLPVTLGLFIPSTTVMIVLLGRKLYPDLEGWTIMGMVDEGEASVAVAAPYQLEASMGYQFTVARVYPNGQIGKIATPYRVDTDGSFNEITPPLPKWPEYLSASATASGAFKISWQYLSPGQGGPPTDFQVFQGATPATIDYGTPLVDAGTSLDHVVYIADGNYEMTTQATYADGSANYFAVRARNSGGVAELNEYYTGPHIALATAPAKATMRTITQRRGE